MFLFEHPDGPAPSSEYDYRRQWRKAVSAAGAGKNICNVNAALAQRHPRDDYPGSARIYREAGALFDAALKTLARLDK